MTTQDDPGGLEDETKKRKRTRSGCLNCRRKKRKCDETRPVCQRCSRVGANCEWGVRVSFRPVHRIPSPERPTTATGSEGQPIQYNILDVTDSVTREYYHDDASDQAGASHEGGRLVARSPQSTGSFTVRDAGGEPRDIIDPPHLPAVSDGFYSDAAPGDSRHKPQATPALATAHQERDLQRPPQRSPPQFRSSGTHYSNSTTPPSQQTEHAATHLLSLSQTSPFAPSTLGTEAPPEGSLRRILSSTSLSEVPDMAGDDLFGPGSTYLNLQSTLRHYLFQESRSTGPTRVATPSSDSDEGALDDRYDMVVRRGGEDETGFPLTQDQEGVLWANWLEEVAPGLDKFDHDNHFQNTLSLLAKSHPHLKYSIMAVSARQMERRGTRANPRPTSLALYQQAIHLLLPQLTTRSTPVIASCVVLCVLEMLSCSPKAWQRHLDGCATLLQAVGIHGFSGSIEQALFWCFARMDVCGGIISSVKTLIPISAWTPHGDLRASIRLFRCSSDFGMYANQAVFLMAQVVDLLSSIGSDMSGYTLSRSQTEDFTERWNELWDILDEWYQLRPGEMHPVFASATDAAFPTVLFSNAAGISGNQLYHTASVLMLQHKPPSATLLSKPRSILWHARRIVGISRSNAHHGAWTNSVQPLWIAGKVFSSPDDHRIIVDLLNTIEKECGWATKWRVDDLREWWGDRQD